MPFKIIKFDKLLNEIKKTHPLEENLSKIIRDIEIEFQFQSLGLFLYDEAFGGYRLKIGRNLSHHYEKNITFYEDDELIKKLKKLEPIHSDEYKFEHPSADVIICPLYFQNEFFGFLFIDGKEKFDKQAVSKLCMFCSVSSMVIFIFKQNQLIKNLNEYEEHIKIYTSEAFKKVLITLFEHSKRYNHPLSIAMFTFSKFHDVMRIYGKHKIKALEEKIVKIMEKYIRKTDKLGRSYNHIILIAMPETDKQKATIPVKRIINEIKKLDLMTDIDFVFGIFELPKDTKDIYEKIKRAEFILEDAKKSKTELVMIDV